MGETLRNNINTTSVSNDAHQTLLLDETNEKSHINKHKHFNDDNLEKNNQKSKIYFGDRFIIILLIIIGLLFLLVIALAIISLLHGYSTTNDFKKSTSQYNTETINRPITTTTNGYISPNNKTMIVNLVQPEVVGTGRAKYVDDTVHYDYEN